MATYKIPDSPKKYKTEYSSFKGVDLSSNPTQVDSARGASGTVNLISDSGGFPEKRKGWRVLLNVEKPVNGLYRGIIKGKEYFLVHGGTRLYKWTENTLTELKSGLTNKQGTSFTLNDKMYVLTGGEYLVFDGETAKDATADAYVLPLPTGRRAAARALKT